MGTPDPPSVVAPPAGALDRWAACLGTFLSLASLGLVALADFGWFQGWLALAVIGLAAATAAALWRPPLQWRLRPSAHAFAGIGALTVAAALIAPGSENIAGPRDPAVYVATGFAIARGGSTLIHDPVLELLARTADPNQINSWLYNNAINGARIRFPAQLFIRDVDSGTVEGGFLPVLPVWIALATHLGGIEGALHVAGVFGVLALAFAMLAAGGAAGGRNGRAAPLWPLVGAILAVSFAQIWWAREPMAESALGAFTWLVAWATARWITGGGRPWAALAGLGTTAALFTRADAVPLAAALALLLACYAEPGRKLMLGILFVGSGAAALHYGLVATVYTSTTFGGVTAGRAAAGIAAVGILGAILVAGFALRRSGAIRPGAAIAKRATFVRRGAVLAIVGLALASALSGIAPGVGRAAGLGAASPLAWLPGYVPWPILGLAAIGAAAWGWMGVARPLVPLLLIGGLPALLYLPDPLVTGDHPWMVRRLVPAVIPLLALAASGGALALWRLRMPGRERLQLVGPLAAALLTGLGLGLATAQDRDLAGPRHAAGVPDGLTALAADLPSNALVVFPAGEAGNHLAMPLDMILGVDAFAITARTASPGIVSTLARMEAVGRAVYWAEDGPLQPVMPEGAVATRDRTSRVRYRIADNGPAPPPLQLRDIDHTITLYRLSFPARTTG